GPTDTSIDVFDRVISINARGSLLVIKYAAASMIRLGRAASSGTGPTQAGRVAPTGPIPNAPPKPPSPTTPPPRRPRLARPNFPANSGNPTVVMPDMSACYWGRPEIGGPYLAQMPLGRWATVDEIAAPIAFLLSDDAAMITGVSLPIDGGYTAR